MPSSTISQLRANAPIFVPKYLTFDVPIYRIGRYLDSDDLERDYFDLYSVHPFEHVNNFLSGFFYSDDWDEESEICKLYTEHITYGSNNDINLLAIDCLCHHISKKNKYGRAIVSFEKKVGQYFEKMRADDVRKLLTESI